MKKISLIALALGSILTLASCSEACYPFLNALVKKYRVTFLDNDGKTVLLEDTVFEHQNYTYNGETPTKEETSTHSYTFSGWDNSLDDITRDTIFRPIFNETRRTYTVKFLNDDNSLLWETTVEAEGSVTYNSSLHPIPSRLPDETTSWEWTGGWIIEDNEGVNGSSLDNVISNLTLKPDFKPSTIKYVVRYYDEDETTILYETEVDAGSYAKYEGPTPTKEDELSSNGETKTVYTFKGWDKSEATTQILSDTNFIAQYESEELPSDRTTVREYILSHYNPNYDKDGYNYVLLSNNYYLGYSKTNRDFSLRVEKEAFSYLLIDNHRVIPSISLTISFDYNELKENGGVVGNFIYHISDELGDINTRFNVSSYGEPPMLSAPKNLDHDGVENNETLSKYIANSDNELSYALSMLSMNAATYFDTNSLPYIY